MAGPRRSDWPRRLYSVALYLLAPLLWWRLRREGSCADARRQRLGRIAPTPAGQGVIWLHCASVGEVQAARPLIQGLLDRYPRHRLVVSTMTATGAARVLALARDHEDGRLFHAFLPLDFPGAAGRFVGRLRPALAILFETELWPNLLAACERRGVPLAVVNGRLSARAFRGYRRIAPLLRDTLQRVDWLAAKSAPDAERFVALGMPAERVAVVGSLKFDLAVAASTRRAASALRDSLGTRPVWVAGSTHEGEDEQVLAAHARLCETMPEALLVLVPRHPRRFEAVARLCRRRGFDPARRSRGDTPNAATAVYLADTMGELLTLYGVGDLAFVGGSLVPVGGHNLLEPAALGVPVLTGPELANFEDVAEVLREAVALVEVADAAALAEALERLLVDAAERRRLATAGEAVVAANRGALARTLAGLEGLLPVEV